MSSIEKIAADCFFAPKPCLVQQVHYLLTLPEEYCEALETLSTKGILSTVSQATKARIFAALCACKKHLAAVNFLYKCDAVEVSKAVEILDRPRLIHQKEAKIALIESKHPHLKEEEESPAHLDMEVEETKEERPKKRRKKSALALLRRQVKELKAQEDETHSCETCAAAHADSAVKEVLASASLSGALALKIRKWAKKFTPDFLEFIVLSESMNVWQKLADTVHFAPADFSLPYFLSVVHGEPVPEGTFVHGMRCLMEAPKTEMAAKFAELGAKFPQLYKSFTFLRTQPRLLADRSIAENLAHHIPLGTAIWYLEELCQASRHAIASILTKRLETEPNWMEEEDSKVAASFAKLVERIMVALSISPELAAALMPAARMRLGALKEIADMHGDTLIIGDASASMQTAIVSATIMAAMISACWGGELCFFSSGYIASPYPRPQTVEEVLGICQKIRANSCTSVAAGLCPAYDKKIVYRRIVLVTDEEENTACHGMRFAQLYRKYKDEVNPAVELLLVGVGSGYDPFQDSLRQLDIEFKRVEVDNRRPDLTKFDALLRQMSLLAASAEAEANVEEIKDQQEDEFVVVEDEDMM